MLAADYKVLTGVLAARLRKTEGHTLSAQQYSASNKKVSHAINQFRDMINNVTANDKGLAEGETDFQAAFDLIAVKWVWKVLKTKGCSPSFISTMRRIYESPNQVVTIINNEEQPKIQNLRNSIKQGCRGSTCLFTFGIDPVLDQLEKNLSGQRYHKMATAGPTHPILGPPPIIETRLKVAGFVDDLKCILRSQDEFRFLDHIISLFESSSGSRLHRNPETKKCQLLALGRWSGWKKANSPLNYMKVTEELNILGVRMTRSTQTTRILNGEELVQRIRNSTNAFKANLHAPMGDKCFSNVQD